mmetsp:Transcript_5020/g.7651  ORF Transcript_5020/g.7651 Transcript_5020/m.7651 type:complete len:202 (-) Transcript_5020:1025-1630(-)
MEGKRLQKFVAKDMRPNLLSSNNLIRSQELHLLIQIISILQLQIINLLIHLLLLQTRRKRLLQLLIRPRTPLMLDRRIMPTLPGLNHIFPSHNRICQITSHWLEFLQFNLLPLLLRRNMPKLFFNHVLRFIGVDIPDNVQQYIIRSIMRPVPRLDIIRLPGANETFLPNWESFREPIFPMKRGENLTFNPILNGIDHGHFR